MLASVAVHRRSGRGGGERRWLAAGYGGLAGFFLLERLLRQPGEPSSLKTSGDDRGTTKLLIAAYGLAVDAPLLARWLPGRPLPPVAAPAGLVVEVTGLAWRAWSMRALGCSYSRTLRVAEGDDRQTVVDAGPYRLIRHPGYLGSLLTWAGFALTSRRAPVVTLILGLLGAAYRQRIAAEEQLLRRELPGYSAYCERTKKLIPYLW
jgi:protein-S-isoprenylcysteine O-methyltransferase Ste14